MKIKNTPANKERFIALYWGQRVLLDVNNGGEPTLYPVDRSNMYRLDESILELTPLSQISDEDSYYVGATVNCWSWAERKQMFFKDDEMSETHIGFGKMFTSSIGKEFGPGLSHPFAHNSTDILHAYDYLRSKGYALPWIGLSVDEQIEYGWVKLSNQTNPDPGH